jgi:inhibitor of KinA
VESPVKILSVGETAIVVEFGTGIHPELHRKVKALTDYLEQASFPGMIEYVPAFSSVTVFYDPLKVKEFTVGQGAVRDQSCYQIVSDRLANIVAKLVDSVVNQPRVVKIPVCYGGDFGPDLTYVAEHNKVTVDDVIKIHASCQYLVYMIGFAPGFPYLGGMSERIATPRRSSPRSAIPAGSVGIAGTQTGVYPIATPGGWQLIGRTPVELFRPRENPPSLLQSGDMIQFCPISQQQFAEYKEADQ